MRKHLSLHLTLFNLIPRQFSVRTGGINTMEFIPVDSFGRERPKFNREDRNGTMNNQWDEWCINAGIKEFV